MHGILVRGALGARRRFGRGDCQLRVGDLLVHVLHQAIIGLILCEQIRPLQFERVEV